VRPIPDNIPEAPPAPVISRSGLVDEVEDEDEEDHHHSRRQKSVQQQDQEQKQSKNKRKKKKKKRGRSHQQEAQKQKAEGKKEADEETGEKSLDFEIEYVCLRDSQLFYFSKGLFTHTMLFPCCAAKGLDCVFPIRFTHCLRLTLSSPVMPCDIIL
jgi:hypothetical protein